MAYYGLQWAGKKVRELLARWEATGGGPPL